MRSVADRIRHAVLFEIIGVLVVSPLAGGLFDAPVQRVGVLAVGISLFATVWNYLYNLAFDHALRRFTGRLYKTPGERIWHALAFELGMLVVTLVPVMWWMGYTLSAALTMNVALMLFYLVYTYVYNLVYDLIFPIPARPPA